MDSNDNNKEYTTISARYIKTIFEHESNGFCVFLCDVIVSGSEADGNVKTAQFKIKGTHLPSTKKVYYQYTGCWENGKNGTEFSVESFTLEMPTSKENIIEFLSSPLIKQVGPKIAGKIYDAFKEKTFDIIENDYKRLAEVKGIKEQKALRIHENYMESKAVNIIYSMLGNAFTFTQATKIYSMYKDLQNAINIISKTPYRLIYHKGITFKMVDELGKKYLDNPNDTGRIVVAGQCVLDNYAVHGNVGMPIDDFLKQTEAILNGDKSAYVEPSEKVDKLTIKTIIGKHSAPSCDAIKKGVAFVYQNKIIFKAKYAKSEQYIAFKLKRLTNYYSQQQNRQDGYVVKELLGEQKCCTIDELIGQYEESNHISLDERQKQAVKQCFEFGTAIITGGPGTGKSATMKAVLYIQNKINNASKIVLLAPTGRAAKRLSEATGAAASTIHSKLHIIPDEGDGLDTSECADTDVVLDADLVIVDEMSMSDMSVMYSLCKSVEIGTRLVFVGDEEQLPSVGPGNVLHDMIHSGVIPTVKLQTIFRQANDSSIIENADRINKGQTDLMYNKDFKFIPASNRECKTESVDNQVLYYSEAVHKTVDLYTRAVKKYGIDNVVLLVPYRKKFTYRYNRHQSTPVYLSVNNLNPIIQQVINKDNLSGPCAKYGDNKFYISDRVMQTKNVKMEGEEETEVYVSNGEIGYVSNIYTIRDEESQKEEIRVVVDYNGQKAVYTKDMLQALDLAYCQTVHKAQGGEYKIVLFGLMNEHSTMLKKRVLYTGVTRGKEFVCLIGEENALAKAIVTSADDESRVTLLCERLHGAVN